MALKLLPLPGPSLVCQPANCASEKEIKKERERERKAFTVFHVRRRSGPQVCCPARFCTRSQSPQNGILKHCDGDAAFLPLFLFLSTLYRRIYSQQDPITTSKHIHRCAPVPQASVNNRCKNLLAMAVVS